MKNQSNISIRRFLCVSLLIVGIIIFSSMRLDAATISYDSPSYNSLIPHDPIFIMSDIGLEVFPGTGTEEDPYVIEGYSTITTNSRGIRITGTTKYFTIRNCYVDAKDYGIYIENVADGTVTVINNSCWGNNNWGIAIHYSSNFTVANNTCNNNYGGIGFYETSSVTVINNTCNNNECAINVLRI